MIFDALPVAVAAGDSILVGIDLGYDESGDSADVQWDEIVGDDLNAGFDDLGNVSN